MIGRAVAGLVVAVVAVAVCAGGATHLSLPAGAAPQPVDRVLILSLPGTTWADIAAAGGPRLRRLLDESAVASASIRTIRSRTRAGDGYATIGSGTLAAGVSAVEGLAFDVREALDGGIAADVYTRVADHPPHAPIVTLAHPRLQADADRRRRDARIGALGDALDAGGVHRAVIGNADTSRPAPLEDHHREAVLALADHAGSLPGGRVDAGLLVADRSAVHGLRLDPDAALAAFRHEWRERSVVLVELSDLARAHGFRAVAGARRSRALARDALTRADALVGSLVDTTDPARDAVIVIAPSSPADGIHLTVAGLRAPGVAPGLLRSASTRRSGYVTLADVAPTVLELTGVPRPSSMEGRPFRLGQAGSVSLEGLVAVDRAARARDALVGPARRAFVTGHVVLYLGVAAALVSGAGEAWRRVARGSALWLLAVPTVIWLATLLGPLRPPAYFAAVGAGAAALAGGAARLGRGRPGLATAGLLGALFAVLVVDVVTGARLQLNAVFGYSPTVGGRFSGFGNLAFAQLAASAALLAGFAAARAGRHALAVSAAVLGVALVADGMPMWGSDVGGVLAAIPAFAVVLAGVAGRPLRLRIWTAAVVAGAAIGGLAAFGAYDLTRAPADRTHLGRLLERLATDGAGALADVILRKADANLTFLPEAAWVPLVPAALGLLAYLAWSRPPRLRAVWLREPALRPAVAGALLAGVLGFALNDTGIAVLSMALAVIVPVLVDAVLRTR